MDLSPTAALAVGAIIGLVLGGTILHFFLAARGRSLGGLTTTARLQAAETLETATLEATSLRDRVSQEAATAHERLLVEARQESAQLRQDAQQDVALRRTEVEKLEQRLGERESRLDAREELLSRDQQSIGDRRDAAQQLEESLKLAVTELEKDRGELNQALEKVAGLTAEQAAAQVRAEVEDAARASAAASAREIREQAQRDAERDARRLIAITTQRLAAVHTADSTVAAVGLPNDEMKGRIIGREGRNIRAFELATGVDVIIDDTPDTVVVSCFDPIRREIAKRALSALVEDGRIHPGRIEELVAKTQDELDSELVDLGERAAYEVDVHGLHEEVLRLIGRMRYRTSYGQNMYEHSKEVSWLAGMMAAELHCDVQLARRGGLLHDIGKVLTHEHEGTHVQLGVEFCRRHGEVDAVLNCIEAHHNDVPHESTESVLVQASDSVSGSRPGARREAIESYMKRLARLEEIANSYEGVEKATVFQAGREVRVVVRPGEVNDVAAEALSQTIARRVEQELQYPGQIRVTVIRETRATEVAK
jgi:ribonuclease Y